MASYGKRKKKKQNRLAMLGIILVVAALIAVLGNKTLQLQQKNDEYLRRLASIEQQLDEEQDRAEALERQRVYVQTIQYIEQEAKDKLGMVNPNEIILKPEQ